MSNDAAPAAPSLHVAAAAGFDSAGVSFRRSLRARRLFSIAHPQEASNAHPAPQPILVALAELEPVIKYAGIHATAVCRELKLSLGRVEGCNLDLAFAIVPVSFNVAGATFASVAELPGSEVVFWRSANTINTQADFTLNWPHPTNISRSLAGIAPGLHAPAVVVALTNEATGASAASAGQAALYLKLEVDVGGFAHF